MKIQTLGVIPARYGAQRFPGKPLALIAGIVVPEKVSVAPGKFGYGSFAATEMAPSDAARIDEWRRARVAYVSAQTSTIRVGHEDVAAWLI